VRTTRSADCPIREPETSTAVSACPSIGYAVTQAGSGDTIHVAPGAYPEMVSVTKSLTFLGANATVPAGISSGARGPESVVEGFRSPGSPHPSSAYAFSVTIEGFTVSPQGDTSLISASGHHLVALFGGPDVEINNNIFDGGPIPLVATRART